MTDPKPREAELPDKGLDPYVVLGVNTDASDDQIKSAYFAQVRAHPPETDPQAFKRIRAAYDRLRDPQKRREADMFRVQAWPEPSLKAVLAAAPALDLTVRAEDVIRAARAQTDLGRRDFREDYREVKW